MTTLPVEPSERHSYLPLGSIDPSKTNPRTHFDKTKLDELAESIARHGVLQPILVRPKGNRFELVAGERRFRAARQIPLEQIPAIVRELDDKATLEIQVVENLQREDLRPLEEAEGYALLIEKHGYDADSLALKIGKSRSYVYGRMKLNDLAEPARKALREDKISHSVALLLARIPDAKLQKEALQRVAGDDHNGPLSFRAAADFIQRNFMLRLSDAPFDRKDATLVPAAGACTTCPLRTGNQSELFSDVKSADVCTSPGCFSKKVEAHLKIEAKEKGYKVLSATDTKKVWPYEHSSHINYGSPFVDVDDKVSYAPGAKKFQDFITDESKIVLARDPDGKIRKLINRKDLPKKFQPKQQSSSARPSAVDNSKWKQKEELREALEKARINAFMSGAVPPLEEAFPIFAQAFAIDRLYEFRKVAAELGIISAKKRKTEGMEPAEIAETLAGLTSERLIAIVAFLFFATDGSYGDPEDLNAQRAAFFTLAGVDLAAVEEKVKAELQAKWDAAKPAKKRGKA
jgi:ParB/RepB/Spo0J family partition protein